MGAAAGAAAMVDVSPPFDDAAMVGLAGTIVAFSANATPSSTPRRERPPETRAVLPPVMGIPLPDLRRWLAASLGDDGSTFK